MTRTTLNTQFDAFLAKWNNKFCEVVDSSNRHQCMDLSRAWFDVLGHGYANSHFYAYEVYTRFNADITGRYFDLIRNTPDYVPLKGDIIVWDKRYNGTAGHIAVATGEGNTTTFKAFSQNDPTGSPCVVRSYNYNHVLGALRLKVVEDVEQENHSQEASKYHQVLKALSSLRWIQDPATEKNDIKDIVAVIEQKNRLIENFSKEAVKYHTVLREFKKKNFITTDRTEDMPAIKFIDEVVKMIESIKIGSGDEEVLTTYKAQIAQLEGEIERLKNRPPETVPMQVVPKSAVGRVLMSWAYMAEDFDWKKISEFVKSFRLKK